MECILTPAYGRDYKSAQAARDDYHADKDFVFHDLKSRWDGKPANKRDLQKAGYTSIKIRYNKLRNFTFVEPKHSKEVTSWLSRGINPTDRPI